MSYTQVPGGGLVSVIEVSGVDALFAALAAAAAGTVVKLLPGTYTLSAATGPIQVPDGVYLLGSGVDQTVITEDGNLPSNYLIDMQDTAVGAYGTGAIGQWATSGTTDVAADAGNISDGDMLYLLDTTSWDSFCVRADGDGIPGSGVFNFTPELCHALPNAATVTVTVFASPSRRVRMSDFTLLGDGANTLSGMYLRGVDGWDVKRVKMEAMLANAFDISYVTDSRFDIDFVDCYTAARFFEFGDIEFWGRSRSTAGAGNFYFQVGGGQYSEFLLKAEGSTVNEYAIILQHIDRCYARTIVGANSTLGSSVYMNASDECMVTHTGRQGVNQAGCAGNDVRAT